MIISHKHKYLFVELPRTGSSAIRRELCEHYDGVPILHKHATYYEFLKIANAEEKRYFVFAGIRNPLDDAVSLYFKRKNDHHGQWTKRAKPIRDRRLFDHVGMIEFNFIKNTDADFPTYFKRFYKIPYNNWSELSHRKFDFIIRFEHLQEDFAKMLKLIGIEQKRPLPVRNKTAGRDRNFLSYYTPEIIPRAKRVFGPYMKQWGYEFPPEWGETSVPWWNQAEFEAFNLVRHCYWRYLRGRI